MNLPELGSRVVWRSGSHNYEAEKVGIVVFVGPAGWRPEKAPRALKHWFDKEWRDTVRRRHPDYEELCRLYPPRGGGRGYCPPRDFHTRWTSRGRYRFERCQSGIVVAVHEYRQLTFDTAKATLKKPKRPLLYAPSETSLRPWPVGSRRPRFPTKPVGTWLFTVHYRHGGDAHVVHDEEGEVWHEGRGHNERAAQRECLKKIHEKTGWSPSSLVIPAKGVPADAKAKKIHGAS
jgi:hypothetical protein